MPNTVEKFLAALTSTRGVMLAAPFALAIGLLLTFGENPADSAEATKPASSATARPDKTAPEGAGTAAPAKAETGKSSFTAAQKKEIGVLVRRYLLANPEVLIEVSEELEKRQKVAKSEQQFKLISSQKDLIFNAPLDYVAGNKDGKINVVEFFDYNCGWCKRAIKEITTLMKKDSDVRIVMKEFPIFGADSEFAAKAAMAAQKQGKYWPFHVAMMKEKRVTRDNVMTIAAKVGLDVEKLKTEMAKPEYENALRRNAAIAQSLGIQGTPGFIIDGQINPGYLPVATMQGIVEDVRKNGCQMC